MLDSETFLGFNGREEELGNILRFNMERRTPMFYRTNDLLHSRRVNVLLRDIAPILEKGYSKKFDVEKALILALVHDDVEIDPRLGDVQAYYKDRMTPEQKVELHTKEIRAIELVSGKWPENIGRFSYRDLLYHALNKDCLEAQVVSYCDKVDALCESLHEVFAGNPNFKEPALEYIQKIREFPTKYPLLSRLLPGEHSLLQFPIDLDAKKIIPIGRFHNFESVREMTGLSHYDRWRELTIERFGVAPLVQVREY